jgi:hypothetical protein
VKNACLPNSHPAVFTGTLLLLWMMILGKRRWMVHLRMLNGTKNMANNGPMKMNALANTKQILLKVYRISM